MTRQIRKVAVLGAGTMGSGIAAHLANAGIEVYLLDDYVPKGASDRAAFPKSQIEKMKKATIFTDPLSAGFMDPDNAKLITCGNMDDDLADALKDADWVIEAIVEDIGKKKNLFARIDQLKKPDTVVSSNTSTIPLHDLIDGRSDSFKKNFLNTHFFNPVRMMRLIELISGPETDPAVTKAINDFCDVKLGKHVVHAKDTPAFIANRIGTFFSFRAMSQALDSGMKIEDVDALLGKPMGFPKDGVFGLTDIVGAQIIPHLIDSLQRTLKPDDEFRKLDGTKVMAVINQMIADGRTGRRSATKMGFYRPKKDAEGNSVKEKGKTVLESLNLQTGGYETVKSDKPEAAAAGKKGPRAVFEVGDDMSDYAWVVMRDTLLYAASLVGEVSDDISDIDAAMRTGYNWQMGPFELLDKIGVKWFIERAKKDGVHLPPALELSGGHPFYEVINGKIHHMEFDFSSKSFSYEVNKTPDGVITLADIKRVSKPVLHNDSASVWDIGDGVLCFEFHSKMNTMDPSILAGLNDTIKLVTNSGGKYKAMVIYNDSDKAFSAGANLGVVSMGFQAAATNKTVKAFGLSGKLENSMTEMVEDTVYQGQAVYKALREAPFPVIGAPNGLALGGGCEILLHCDAVQAGAETYMALVESGVGVIPGWGGTVRMLERFQNAPDTKKGPFAAVRRAFMAIMLPQVSASAQDAQRKLWMLPTDGISMNKDRILSDAKAKALAMAPGYTPPQPAQFHLPGRDAKYALMAGLDDFYNGGSATYHDVVVGDALATVLTGGETNMSKTLSEDDVRHLEREAFMSLVGTKETRARIAYMIKNNKPLREKPLKEAKTLDEIRANRTDVTLPRKDMNGKPLAGKDEKSLKKSARNTAFLMRRFG